MPDLFEMMNLSFDRQFLERPLNEPEESRWTEGQMKAWRERLVRKKQEEIAEEGIDAIINHDVLEHHYVKEAYDSGDGLQFMRMIHMAYRESAKADVDAMDDEEVYRWFREDV